MGQRQSGRTTEQLLSAPQGAIYVWPHHHSLFYPKALAVHVGRADLVFCPAAWLEHADNFVGRRSPVVIDHAAWELIGSAALQGVRYLRDVGRLSGSLDLAKEDAA